MKLTIPLLALITTSSAQFPDVAPHPPEERGASKPTTSIAASSTGHCSSNTDTQPLCNLRTIAHDGGMSRQNYQATVYNLTKAACGERAAKSHQRDFEFFPPDTQDCDAVRMCTGYATMSEARQFDLYKHTGTRAVWYCHMYANNKALFDWKEYGWVKNGSVARYYFYDQVQRPTKWKGRGKGMGGGGGV